MKKLALSVVTSFLLLALIPTQLKAATESNPVSVSATKPVESADANAQLARLEEIKAMDMSTLNRSEKKELRKEVREIKNDQDGRGRRYHDGNRSNVNVRSSGTFYVYGGSGLLLILLIILLI